ncbi:MAG: hypothetical protein HW413_29 [Thermoleophilia bacterium]|nr:hypothetical protein [Thermoleophilia bacterium]
MRKTLVTGALVAALGALLLTLAGTAPAAKRGSVIVRGQCSAASTFKLKANPPSNGRIEIEFEVDQNVNGQVWQVTLSHNGSAVLTTRAKTKAPSGSFTVRASVTDRAGADGIGAVAMNGKTGESCTASLSI